MRVKTSAVVFFCLLPFLGFAQSGAAPIITVMSFQANGVSEGEVMVFTDFISSHIVQTGQYTVIDRMQRQAILSEIEFSNSDCSDEACQLEIGKMLSAKYIIVGSLGRFGSRFLSNIKLIEVETSRSVGAASKIYGTLEELLEDSGWLTRNLLATAGGVAAGGAGAAAAQSQVPAASAAAVETKAAGAPPAEPVRTAAVVPAAAPATAAPAAAAVPPKPAYPVIPTATIKVDGKPEDWAGIAPFFRDVVGDDRDAPSPRSGTDIREVYLARDDKELYVRFELADGRPNSGLEYIEYNTLLFREGDVLYRVQITCQQRRWTARFTQWDGRAGKMTMLSAGRVRIRGNSFEASCRLSGILEHVPAGRLSWVNADIGYGYGGGWVVADSTAGLITRF